MRKIKIFITVFALYEFTMLTILQVPDYCLSVFNFNFCNVPFKYFLMCVMLPCLIGLFFWWIPDIGRLFCKKCQCNVSDDKSVKSILQDIISKKDIERFITAAVVMGIQKFATTHPQTQETFKNIIDVIKRTKPVDK